MVGVWLSAVTANVEEVPPVGEFRFLWLALVGAILLGALVIFGVDRWRKRSQADQLSSGDQLTQFRVLYERGEMSREEYERVRSLLGQRLRKELDVPARPTGAPGPETPPPVPPPADSPESGTRPA